MDEGFGENQEAGLLLVLLMVFVVAIDVVDDVVVAIDVVDDVVVVD